MSTLPPQPVLAALEDLLRRHDGPLPTEELLRAIAGGSDGAVRRPAVSREVDRMVLDVSRLIAARGEDLRRATVQSQTGGDTVEALADRLTRYRMFGLRLAEA